MKQLFVEIKLFWELDKIGLTFFILGAFILILSIPLHLLICKNLFIEYCTIDKLTFVDRFCALALAFLIYSEFSLNHIYNNHRLSLLQKAITRWADAQHLSAIENNKSFYQISNILYQHISTKNDISKPPKPTSSVLPNNTFVNKDENNKLQASMEFSNALILHFKLIQRIILIFIMISTIGWGFGSLLPF